MGRCVSALKRWTGKASATIIFDSTVDEFTADGLFNKVRGKPNIAIVATTTDGDVFGGFYSVAVTEQDRLFDDPNMFVFSFESRGRCMTPQRFVVKVDRKKEACLEFFKNDIYGFVEFKVVCGGHFWLGDERSHSFCWDMCDACEELQNKTLSGKSGIRDEDEHHCARLVAVRLF